MKQRPPVDSREVGLVLGLILGRYFFDLDDLHFGYWPEGLPVKLANLRQAQENYSQFVIDHLPPGVKSILDVGCGAGNFTARLIRLGYQVEGVSPSRLLSREVRKKLGDSFVLHPCRLEDLAPVRTYDLVLFSESFQYLKLRPALDKISALLRPGGYFCICDFFKTEAPGKSPIGGGHRLRKFYDLVGSYPFQPMLDLDLTSETAPTIDLVHDAITQAGEPALELVRDFLQSNYPRFYPLLLWVFRKRIQKIQAKYLNGVRTAATFARFKSYRFLLYRKNAPAPEGKAVPGTNH